ncbi:MAG TPA: MarR family transcriptional regulator [Desulfobacterales bacterium]|nr:MarR family transcriptional regulator [Desulfobacterales bacterium]
MTKLPNNIPDCMVFLLAKAFQKAHANFKKQLTPYGLTNLQHLVLEGLWYEQGMTATQLGKSLILDKATLSGILGRMLNGGWIKKKPNKNDKRQLSIYTSQKADALKKNLIKERQNANDDILKTFSTEEKILFKRFLTDVINAE